MASTSVADNDAPHLSSLSPSRSPSVPLQHQSYTSAQESCTLREALAWVYPGSSEDEPVGISAETTLVGSQPFSLTEALVDLKPASDYSLVEALEGLKPDFYLSEGSDEEDPNMTHMAIGKELGVQTGDIIVKEVADWLDAQACPRRISLNDQPLAYAVIASQFLFPPSMPSSPSDSSMTSGYMSATAKEETRSLIIHLTVLQLLACTFTISPAPSLPATLYLSRHERQQPEMISVLRLHSLVSTCSPAAGNQARYNSVAPAWPGLFERPCREEIWADEITRRRLERLKEAERSGNGVVKDSDASFPDPKLVRWMWDEGSSEYGLNHWNLDDGGHATPSSAASSGKQRRISDVEALPDSRKRIKRGRDNATTFSSSVETSSSGTLSSTMPLSATSRSTNGRRITYPLILHEPHPVFLQPVKVLALRRRWVSWKQRRARWQRQSISRDDPGDGDVGFGVGSGLGGAGGTYGGSLDGRGVGGK